MRQRAAAFGQRTSALRNRFRPSERRANQLWKALIVFAIVLPFVSMAWEMLRHNLIATIVFALILITWAAVMLWAWRQGSSGGAETAPASPGQPAAAPAPQIAPRKENAGRRAGRK